MSKRALTNQDDLKAADAAAILSRRLGITTRHARRVIAPHLTPDRTVSRAFIERYVGMPLSLWTGAPRYPVARGRHHWTPTPFKFRSPQ
jgi:hypothetical protein